MASGMVTRIQRFSLADGPGIRTTVFLKGCPLRCAWCANPETQEAAPEAALYPSRCLPGCRECVAACRSGALSRQGAAPASIDRFKCERSFCCAEACPSKAIIRYGRQMSAEAVAAEISRDEAYYRRSGGGATLSGGEPLFQPEFSFRILEACRSAGWSTALDTAGAGPWPELARLLSVSDIVLYDLKHMDSVKHREFTGVGNEAVLENARETAAFGVRFIARIPLIPGFNDADAELEALAGFVGELRSVESIDILPFHRLGRPKYDALGREWPIGEREPPSAAAISRARDILGCSGVPVRV